MPERVPAVAFPAFPAFIASSIVAVDPFNISADRLFELRTPKILGGEFARPDANNPNLGMWLGVRTKYAEDVNKIIFEMRQRNFALGYLIGLASGGTGWLRALRWPERYIGETPEQQRNRCALSLGLAVMSWFDTSPNATAWYTNATRGYHPAELQFQIARGRNNTPEDALPVGVDRASAAVAWWQNALLAGLRANLRALTAFPPGAEPALDAAIQTIPADFWRAVMASGLPPERKANADPRIRRMPRFLWMRGLYGVAEVLPQSAAGARSSAGTFDAIAREFQRSVGGAMKELARVTENIMAVTPDGVIGSMTASAVWYAVALASIYAPPPIGVLLTLYAMMAATSPAVTARATREVGELIASGDTSIDWQALAAASLADGGAWAMRGTIALSVMAMPIIGVAASATVLVSGALAIAGIIYGTLAAWSQDEMERAAEDPRTLPRPKTNALGIVLAIGAGVVTLGLITAGTIAAVKNSER